MPKNCIVLKKDQGGKNLKTQLLRREMLAGVSFGNFLRKSGGIKDLLRKEILGSQKNTFETQ